MATCVENVDDDAGHHLVQVSSKEMAQPVTIWDRREWPNSKPIFALSLEEAERIGLALIRCVAGHRAYVDNYELWHGPGGKEAATAIKLSEPATDPPNDEVLREVESAVFNGHGEPNCVDWDNWKFCSGLYFAVHRCERAGHTRDAIKAAFYRAVALNTR